MAEGEVGRAPRATWARRPRHARRRLREDGEADKPGPRRREREKKAGAGAREAGLTGRAHGQRGFGASALQIVCDQRSSSHSPLLCSCFVQGQVSSELHARRGRGEGGRAQLGGGYGGTTGLTARARGAEREKKAGAGARKAGLTGRAHGQRERGSGRTRGEAAAPTGGAGRAERAGGGRAQGGPTGPKGRGGRGSGLLCLFLLF